MSYCTQCASSIPEEQSICSMCMGDIDYGRDGYYRQWAEDEERRQRERERTEEEME